MAKNFDVIFGKYIARNVYKIMIQDRLSDEVGVDLELINIINLIKSFIKKNLFTNGDHIESISDKLRERFQNFIELTEVTKKDVETLLMSIRYEEFDLFIIARNDLDTEVEISDDFDIITYLLSQLNISNICSCYFSGIANMYQFNEAGMAYPYAVDFLDKLPLSDSEKSYFEIPVAIENYNTLLSINSLGDYDDSHAKNLISNAGMKFMIFTTTA